MLVATEYEILRGVPVSGLKKTRLERKPIRVATIIDEDEFVRSGGVLAHNRSVFLEDRIHDWDWSDGWLRYYTRVAEDAADIVVVFAEQRT